METAPQAEPQQGTIKALVMSTEYAALSVQEIEPRLYPVSLDGDNYRAAMRNIAKTGRRDLSAERFMTG